MDRAARFSLVKWYLDLVTPDGVAVIAYAARVCWRHVSLNYSSILVSDPGGRSYEQHRFGPGDTPELGGDVLTWNHNPLGIVVSWERLQPPIQRRLLADRAGEIAWSCVMPCARAHACVDGRGFDGLGYAEHLSMSITPWRLPFRTLRWGRYTSPAHSVVWIQWAGSDSRRYLWFDGIEQEGSWLTEHAVGNASGDMTVSWVDARAVCRRQPLLQIADALPSSIRRLATPLLVMREHKQLAPSTFEYRGHTRESGWTLFEDVIW